MLLFAQGGHNARIGATCGTHFTPGEQPPAQCPICEGERQHVGHQSQQWTTRDTLRAERHTVIREQEPGLIGIGIEPTFAIGPCALLVESSDSHLLWDCIPLIDDAVGERGGSSAVTISHPLYSSGMVEWSRAFDNVPIYPHADDRR